MFAPHRPLPDAGPRLRERITDNDRLPLPGSRSPLADAGQDLGPLPADKVLHGITLVFKRSAAQQADLETLLAAQQDPKSPLYHHWLTPDAFAARFGMADSDLQTTTAWLKSHGFTVESVPPSHDRISFSGSVALVNAAFRSDLHSYQLASETHFGPATDLFLPASLAPTVSAMLHVSDLRPKPNAQPRPDYTDFTTGKHFLTPADLAVMYDINPASSQLLKGEGQSIAVVGQSYVSLATGEPVQNFLGTLNLDASVAEILVPGTGVQATSPGDLAESELDLEYAAGIAPKAQTYLVYVGDSPNFDVFDALGFAIQQNVAPVISISYSMCEALLSPATLDSHNALFMQAAAQGQTLVAASGDSGSTGCARFTSPSLTATQKQALAVDFPGSSPYVTAVGGTQMASGTYGNDATAFWAPSGDYGLTLLSYVPEVAWNEGTASNSVLAGGGGASTYFPRPAWQANFPGMPAGTTRLVPDIALQSSTSSPGFLICTEDPAFVGYQTTGCYTSLLDSNGHYTIAGGTSFAAPTFAGSVALLNQSTQQSGQGNLNPTLYAMAADPNISAESFHDILTGSIACVSGAIGGTPAGQAGYPATPGFDLATGLGSLDMGKLRAAWPSSSGETGGKLSTSLDIEYDGGWLISNESVSPSAAVTLQIYGVPGEGQNRTAPTGSVRYSLDGTRVDEDEPLLPIDNIASPYSTAAFTVTAPSAAGTHIVKVYYPGDATHLPATAIFPLLVGPVQPAGGLTLSSSNLTLTDNTAGTVQITLTPTGGYHGEISWSLSTTAAGGSSTSVACLSISPVRVSGPTSTKLAFGAGTACNSPLPSATSARRFLPRSTRVGWNSSYKKPLAPVLAAVFGLFVTGVSSRRRRSLARIGALLSITLFVATIGMAGCGGGSGATTGANPPGGTGNKTPPATPAVYTLTLTGHDSVNTDISAATTITFTVN